MSRQGQPRNLSLTEELEKLEQSITLTLQEIDSNFSKAHRIVTTSILPTVDEYAKHSSDVWEGSKFWKQFFEASANVSLSGYEENAGEEDTTNNETTSTNLQTPTDHDEYVRGGAHEQDTEAEFSIESPTQVTGVQTTPKLSASTKQRMNGKASTGSMRSPSPRKYTGNNPMARGTPASEGPSTPRPTTGTAALPQSSPFEPESAYRPSTQRKQSNHDPLMHRMLDKNYRVQATPHTQRRQRQQAAASASNPTPGTATQRTLWQDSPQSSPAMAAPELRSDLFSPAKATGISRTPGVSVMTPGTRKTTAPAPTTSTGRRLFSPQDKSAGKDRTSRIFASESDDDEDDGLGDMSPPKTMQFHVPQSRLVQTPAREASRKIVDDLLLTAGADATDEIEGEDDEIDFTEDEPSPSVIRGAYNVENDTF